jgi:hypothetical protein
MLAHLAAKQLDSVMDREEFVLDSGYRADLLNNNHEVHLNIFFAVFEVFVVFWGGIALFKIVCRSSFCILFTRPG